VGKAVASHKSQVASPRSQVASPKSQVASPKSQVASHKSQVAQPAVRSPQLLDRVIHERLRLGIVSALAVNDRLTFNDLKRLLQTTDGNLSVHARKLEDAQYIACDKTFEGRMPRTEYRLTAAGRRALEKYVAHMEAILKAVRD
jgi:DNA-binding HxlR family transcriptional regulator